MRSVLALTCGLLVVTATPSLDAAAQSDAASVAPFRSIEARNGTHAIVRYGPAHRVTFLKGSADHTRITVTGDRLVIDKCRSKCARGYGLEVEIVTPEITHLTMAHGGWVESRGSFPRQAAVGVTVDNGGTIDIRSMSVASITASVLSGGRILVKPLAAMTATVVDGGNITYWGDARVTQSIEHGGVVERGAPSDADTPLSELGAPFATVPPTPAGRQTSGRWR
jgi:hypothetical protein